MAGTLVDAKERPWPLFMKEKRQPFGELCPRDRPAACSQDPLCVRVGFSAADRASGMRGNGFSREGLREASRKGSGGAAQGGSPARR